MGGRNFTVGDMRRALAGLEDGDELHFAGGLEFYRVKQRGENLQVVEFNEAEGYLTAPFRRRNPGVKVVFFESPEIAEGQIVGGPVDVEVR
jgi:hypothetical protein